MRGSHFREMNAKRFEETRNRILEYMIKHPFARQYEIAEALGINLTTVNRHVSAIRKETQNEPKLK